MKEKNCLHKCLANAVVVPAFREHSGVTFVFCAVTRLEQKEGKGGRDTGHQRETLKESEPCCFLPFVCFFMREKDICIMTVGEGKD